MTRSSFSRRCTSVVFALMLVFITSAGAASSVAAYDLDTPPQASFTANGNVTICYGSGSTETIYTHRDDASAFIQRTWGTLGQGNLSLTSLGLCGHVGSSVFNQAEVRVVYDREAGSPLGESECQDYQIPNSGGPYGVVAVPTTFAWDHITIWVTTDCIYEDRFDLDCRLGTWNTDASNVNTQICYGSLIEHEFGHTLGLGDTCDAPDDDETTCDTRAIMLAAALAGTCPIMGQTHGLARDDTNGLKAEFNQLVGWNYTQIEDAPLQPTCYA